ncbi:macro domain-containing protein [Providencia stuartii]|uniref:macro domain-containing protein n=1 Tax=Providencia sp. 2023EL-00965 TaxID=3084975 RepID=UPI00298ECF29|nr:macro domain-containing protein [Providencia sp. 2023EL-00965]MDW7587597.1 macro domain-containing protein [Providencia sp. 2023EL-00965]
MIKYQYGDILESETVALVNAVNCQGVMGKGLAYQFKERYPKNYWVYKNACENNKFKIGDILVVEENNKLIVNFPTKDSWRKKSQYDFITKGLESLKRIILEKNITSISIPPLGCGNGGLEWQRVENIIINILSDLDFVEIILFPPIIAKDISNKKDLLNVKHLLVFHAANKLNNKKIYNLHLLFYMCQIILNNNIFKFDNKDHEPHSSELDSITAELKNLKMKYKNNLDLHIDEFINTHLTKNMKLEFQKPIPVLNSCIQLINSFESKNEYLSTYNIISLIKNNREIDANEFNKSLLNKMMAFEIIEKNMFGQYSLCNKNT